MGLIHVPKEPVLMQKRFSPLIPVYQRYCQNHPYLRHYIHWAIHVHAFQNVIAEIPE
jgi:hypothetical protein